MTENTPNPQYQEVLAAAQQVCGPDTDWVTFFRKVMGVDGIVRKAFPTLDELSEFEKSEEYATIQRIVVKLREKKGGSDAETEPTRVITVRLPKSMHEYLQTEAHDMRTSMNKLCISKLLQVVEQDMIPVERTSPARRRASAPAPQNPTASNHSNGETSVNRFAVTNPTPTFKTY
jgi:predicted HicB family RNase H-like nuclease